MKDINSCFSTKFTEENQIVDLACTIVGVQACCLHKVIDRHLRKVHLTCFPSSIMLHNKLLEGDIMHLFKYI